MENNKYGTYMNIGVALFKLGKINQSIVFFKNAINENPKIDLAYDNLGVSYLEIGKFEEAIKNFISALKLNKDNINSQNNLINILSLAKPKNIDNYIFTKVDYQISKILTVYKIKNVLDENNIKKILEVSDNIMKNLEKNIYFNETQIFRKNSINLNCKRHFKVFNKFKIIPKYCFSCYKVQINLKNVVDLIKLHFIFDNLYLENNNTRKCIIEIRNHIKGNYKGYVYCEGLPDAKIVKDKIQNILIKSKIENFHIMIKHGCSEFYRIYPKFENINYHGEQEIIYNQDWEEKENIIDNVEPIRINVDKKVWQASLKGLNLSDVLIIKNWISYANTIGDFTYKRIYEKDIKNSSYVKNILIDQLQFRKDNFR
jgi:tetratricopeptide (TPR) repeat protein